MKNVWLFLSVFSVVFLFTACQKDDIPQAAEKAVTPQQSNSSHVHGRNCGMEMHMQQLMKDPAYKKQHQLRLERVNNMPESRSANCTDPTILPVAVHFQGVNNPDIACLRALAQSQVQILNDDYQGKNSDITNWTNNASNSFPGVSNGEGCFELCIATKNHPSGYGLSDGDLAVTVNKTSGDNDANWSGYINIFVQPNTGILGYSPLGGSGNGDGVVIDANAFGSGTGCNNVQPQAPYNLGRTLTHELGHYLLLDHIWGNGCGADDLVGDTPNSASSYGGCPNIGAASCGSTDMHMNYMDYTNDACMYMFSAGQVARSENYINTSLQNVVNNAANVCGTGNGGGGGGNTPTCNDGIQNGDEQGIDCGGSNCPPCQTPPTACETPTNIQVQAFQTEADLTWDIVPAATKYKVRYREQGTTTWTTKNANTNAYTITGLAANTTYEYRIRSICANGEKSPFSPKATFTTLSGGGGGTGNCSTGTQVDLVLTLDDYGSETTWYVVDDATYEIVAEGGPYQDGQDGTVIDASTCLEDGCYFFAIFDDYGDGICCDYGDGSYDLLDGDGTIFASSDGQFGQAEFVDFCVDDGDIEVFFFRKAPKLARSIPKIKGAIQNGNIKKSLSEIRAMRNLVK